MTAVLSALPMALSSCGTAQQSSEEQGGQEEPETGNGQDDRERTGIMELTDAGDETSETGGNGASGVPETAAGEPAEVRDGTWAVGDAGEIEFTLQDGGLTLDDVRLNQS
jgi:hypothetical protein